MKVQLVALLRAAVASTPAQWPPKILAELAAQVRATEIAFAKTLADRDVKTFRSMIAPDVIWLADQPLRGPDEVLTRWQKFFDAAQPPFSWAPEIVEVQEGGKLALSTGPGAQPRRETYRHLHLDLASRSLGRVEDHLRSRLPGLRQPAPNDRTADRRSRAVLRSRWRPARGATCAAQESGDLRLWYRQPAEQWTEALPLGNGRLGAMIFGGVARERLQLNEDTLYAGGPYDPADPEARIALPRVRELIAEGKYAEAQALANEKMMARPLRMPSYQTVGDLLLTFGASGFAEDYRRELDLDTAVAGVEYRQDGVGYRRETFASAVDQVIVMRIRADRAGRASTCAPASKRPCPAACGSKATR